MEKRILALLVDYVLIYGPICILVFFLDIYESTLDDSMLMILIIVILLLYLLLPIELVCKDMIGKRSIGKRIAGLKVVRLDGREPTYKQLLIRNIFMLIASVEVIIIVFFDKPRLGDRVAKTKVVKQ